MRSVLGSLCKETTVLWTPRQSINYIEYANSPDAFSYITITDLIDEDSCSVNTVVGIGILSGSATRIQNSHVWEEYELSGTPNGIII